MQGKLPLHFLKDITCNFSNEKELGRGGFAVVYKGVLPFGNVIAVKRLNAMTGTYEEQFEAEVNVLMKLKHKNIVDLLGYCDGREEKGNTDAAMQEKLLCYEYLPKGSLAKFLSGKSSELRWHHRFEIIEGICSGLQYLHEDWGSTPIIHLDLKPSNILLDDNLLPKIADFGLSRLFGEEQTRICTMNVVGSIGYIAPEYYHTGEISIKSDIFSFGILIFEIVTGMENHPVRSDLSADNFIENIRDNWSEMSQIASKFPLLETCDLQQVKQCIKIGLNCVQTDPNIRPTTSKIIRMLGGCSSLSSAVLNRCPTNSSSVSCKSNNATGLQVDQARQLVERADDDMWKKFLDPGNEHKRQLIDQVVTASMTLDGSTLIAVRMLLEMFWLKRKCLRRLLP